MRPVALVNLKARYLDGEVIFSWTAPPTTPDTVYILPVISVGETRRINLADVKECKLRDYVTGIRFKFDAKSSDDVTRCEFLVFLLNSDTDIPAQERLLNNSDFCVSVTAGAGTIYYDIKSKNVGSGFVRHEITLKSDCRIAEGILGYTFSSDGVKFCIPFPGGIGIGKKKYPPFFTKSDGDVYLEIVNASNSDVQMIKKPLGGLFG